MASGPCMCGAVDCSSCYPGNQYGIPCSNCGQEFDDCNCDEFDPCYDEVDYNNGYDPDEEDRMADYVASKWEREYLDRMD